MFFGPTDLARIYYGAPELPASSFKDDFSLVSKMTEIRNVELHYHLQSDSIHERFEYPWLPSMSDFRRSCPIWHFVDAANEGSKPTCDIFVTYYGKGELLYDYDAMLNPLLCLMESLTLAGFETVAVKIVPGMLYDGSKCPLPSETSMKLLRHNLENFMGVAKVTYAGDECQMKFRALRLAETWSKQPRGGEATRARSRAVRMRQQRRAKRGLRKLQKI